MVVALAIAAALNAVLAAGLAAIAWCVSRCLKWPALSHALWLLVLLKLITPPLIELPVPAAEWVPAAIRETCEEAQQAWRAWRPWSTVSRPQVAERATADSSWPNVSTSSVANSTAISSAAEAFPQSSAATGGPDSAVTTGNALVGNPVRATTSRFLFAQWSWWQILAAMGFVVWAAGVITLTVRSVWQVIRFQQLLARAEPTPAIVEDQFQQLARELGLRRAPRLVFLDCVLTPLLWGCGSHATLVFPRKLWLQLEQPHQQSLLRHELAHFCRGDHWVRLIELVVSILYWWCPLTWWIREELEAAEELCCDSEVIRGAPQFARPYAEALLAALDYVAEAQPVLPPAASGVGDVPLLERRLRNIVIGRRIAPLTRGWKIGLTVAALVALPVQPTLTGWQLPAATAAISSPLPPALDLSETTSASPAQPVVPSGLYEATLPQRRTQPRTQPTPARVPWWSQRPAERWASSAAPNQQYRVVAESGGHVFLEQLATSQRFDLTPWQIRCVVWQPDSQTFVTGSEDGGVRLWDPAAGEPISLIGQHRAAVVALDQSESGQRLASGDQDGTIIVWDLVTSGVAASWTTRDTPLQSVRFRADQQAVLTVAGDWTSGTGSTCEIYELSQERVTLRWVTETHLAAATWSPSGSDIWTLEWSGLVHHWAGAVEGSAMRQGSGWSLFGLFPSQGSAAAGPTRIWRDPAPLGMVPKDSVGAVAFAGPSVWLSTMSRLATRPQVTAQPLVERGGPVSIGPDFSDTTFFNPLTPWMPVEGRSREDVRGVESTLPYPLDNPQPLSNDRQVTPQSRSKLQERVGPSTKF